MTATLRRVPPPVMVSAAVVRDAVSGGI